MSKDEVSWIADLARDGYAILEGVATPDRVAELIEATREYASTAHDGRLDRRGEVYGGRDLLWRIPEIGRLARSLELMAIAQAALGPGAFAVRGLFFDKTPTVNWNLPWHQDLTIAVQERRDRPGFGPWTRKGGIPHAHAPAELLARMVTIRLHLDDCGPSSGPMRVLPGSHASGRLEPGAVASWTSRASTHAADCLVPAGGVVVMRPLLLHASASGTGADHRRVIHLEYAAEDLPGGLEWYRSANADDVE
jgi:ectoine hydroxylase-related dioxygenase (phytanoyl-CoA dioxygenase family)